MIGQQHSDGQVISGALWKIRSELPASQQAAFDTAILKVVSAFGAFDTYATAAAMILAEVEASLGAPARAAAETVLKARQVIDCPRAAPLIHPEVTGPNNSIEFRWRILARAAQDDHKVAPVPVQFSVDVSKPVDTLTFNVEAYFCASAVGYLKAETPITWNWNAAPGSPAVSDADAISNVEPQSRDGRLSTVSFRGPFNAGTYYLHLANTGASSCLLAPQII